MSDVLRALDGEHTELLARLALFREKCLHRALTYDLRRLLNDIHDALVTHFRVEQDTMKLLRYGGIWDHTDEHFVIWHAMIRLLETCERQHFDARCGELVFNTMSGLLTRHVERYDRDFLLFAAAKVKK